MAAPHVSGAAALYLAANPAATAADVVKAIKSSARRVAEMGRKASTEDYGSGLLDLPALLTKETV